MVFKDIGLYQALKEILVELEKEGSIVITESSENFTAQKVHDKLLEVIHTKAGLTSSEFCGIRALIFQAVNNEKFFDWEMPMLTGFSKEDFITILNKLPRD